MSHLRSLVADQRSVVVFGGSYGGMLSSWMRARRGTVLISTATLRLSKVAIENPI